MAACVVATDLALLWSPRQGAKAGGRFVRPSQAVFLRPGERPHDAVLQMCGRMGLLIVEPPEHLTQVLSLCERLASLQCDSCYCATYCCRICSLI